MRVTNRMLSETFLRTLHANMARMEQSQRQLASGKALQRPSDDPIAAGRALSVRESLAQNEQYQRNIDAARAFAATSAQALQSIVDLVQRARELAVQGATDSLAPSQLQAISQEAEQLLRQAVSLGNSKYQSYYVFGGTDESTAPFTLVEGATFNVTPPVGPGDVRREIAVGEQIRVNLPGDQVLPEVLNALASLYNGTKSGSRDDVQASITQLDTGLDSLLGGIAEMGARLNRLESTQERHRDVALMLKELLSLAEDADVAEVVTRLSMEQMTYQAALAAGAKILQPSLMDFLR